MKKYIVAGVCTLAVASAAPAGDADAHAWPDSRTCGTTRNHLGILANGPTSCAFARNTVRAFSDVPTGEVRYSVYAPRRATRRVWSPITHRWYRMYGRFVMPRGGGWHYHMTGGNGAHVDIVS